jgi:hypothetical protein
MSANNIEALKHLGISEETLFFRFQNQEIAALILLISSSVPTTFSESIM